MKKILIIEDEILVAKGLMHLLINNGYAVCGTATNCKDAKKLFISEMPDLILCDINMNDDKTGLEIIAEMRTTSTTPVIFITAYSDQETIEAAHSLKVANFITKPFNDIQVLTAVRGALLVPTNLDDGKLTIREHAVLQLIANGYSTKEVSQLLNISFNTVETHRKKMMKRFNVKTMAQLVHIATGKGWLEFSK